MYVQEKWLSKTKNSADIIISDYVHMLRSTFLCLLLPKITWRNYFNGSTIERRTTERRMTECQTTECRTFKKTLNVERPNVERPNVELFECQMSNVEHG
jgi:hypothetical protein